VFRGAFWTWPVFSQDWRPESVYLFFVCLLDQTSQVPSGLGEC